MNEKTNYVKNKKEVEKMKGKSKKINKIPAYLMLILIVNWFFLTSLVPISEAVDSLIGIELFTNQKSDNSSKTSPSHPFIFDTEHTQYDVDFSVSGGSLADVNLLNGKKQVILTIPENLKGNHPDESYIYANGPARIEVDVLLSEGVPVLGPLLKVVVDLVGGLLSVVGLLLPIAKRISNLLKRLFNIGKVEYEAEIYHMGDYLMIEYEDGLVNAILANLVDIVEEILSLLDDLPLVGLLLGPVKRAIRELLETILNPTGELLDGLLNASVLSNTTVTFPTTIYQPNDEWFGDESGIVKETFAMNIVQTEFIDLNVFKQSKSTSDVYFSGIKQDKQMSLIVPDTLNFGKHSIQTTQDETWVATLDGQPSSNLTTGSFEYEDSTLDENNLQVKVEQETNWLLKDGSTALEGAKLYIYGSKLIINGFTDTQIIYPLALETVELETGRVQNLIQLKGGKDRGELAFTFDKFELFVPKNQVKKIGEYETILQWTTSLSP